MAIRSKVKRITRKRRTAVLPSKNRHTNRSTRAGDSPKAKLAPELKPAQSGVNTFSRAIRYLGSLSDYERLRIVGQRRVNTNLAGNRTGAATSKASAIFCATTAAVN